MNDRHPDGPRTSWICRRKVPWLIPRVHRLRDTRDRQQKTELTAIAPFGKAFCYPNILFQVIEPCPINPMVIADSALLSDVATPMTRVSQ